jgi:magnesium transporter
MVPEVDDGVVHLFRLGDATTSGLVCALAVLQSGRLRRAALELRDRARELAAAMDVDAESVPLEDILTLKGRLLDMDRMVDEQLAVFDILQAIDKIHLDLVQIAESFNLAVGNFQAADRRQERLDRVVKGLQQRYESLQQEKTNRRLGVLTILSAIFMPLTFIAGIYGMNFDLMPEPHFHYGYPVILGGMGAIAGGLYWYFRSRGWLE